MPDQGHGLVETSASLNSGFRPNHSDKLMVNTTTLDAHIQSHPLARNSRLVIKIDVESLGETVLRGSMKTIAARRPALLIEILLGANLDFYRAFMDDNNYNHYPLVNNINCLFASSDIVPSLRQRDHLLMPREHRPPRAQVVKLCALAIQQPSHKIRGATRMDAAERYP